VRVWLSLLVAIAGSAGGCGKASPPFVDGGPGRVLDILDPPGQQLGLKIGQTIALRVRYRLDDASLDVLRDQEVAFSIVTPSKDDDPGDSTISHDADATDDDGVATVDLTAGDEEGLSFGVQASAPGAANVVFDVTVSDRPHVTLDAVLADPLPQPGTRKLGAALFSGKTCHDVGETTPLDGAIEVTGNAIANLHVSSSAIDTDFTVKLVVVYPPGPDYPRGFAMNLAHGILRMRFRKDFEHPEPIEPGAVYAISIPLFPTSNLFAAGHRIRIEIASSNFPHFDVNPNKDWRIRGAPSQVARNTIHCGGETPSSILLPVIPAA